MTIRERILRWIDGWALMFDGIACVVTFTLYRPSMSSRMSVLIIAEMFNGMYRKKADK